MKEFKWFEDLTDSVLLSLTIWVALAAFSHLFKFGGLISAALQIIGLFIFVKSLWKWWKRKPKKTIKFQMGEEKEHPKTKLEEGEELYAYAVWRRPSKVYMIRVLASLGIVLVVVGTYYFIYKDNQNRARENAHKYEQCLNECIDAQMTNSQESICKRECIGKYR